MNRDTFYEREVDDFTFVPFDIETTGFYDTDIITTFTMCHRRNGDQRYDAWLNTDGRDTPNDLERVVQDASGIDDVQIRACDDEAELLSSVRRHIQREFEESTTILTAYNGECWKGGFDIRFIRSACLRTGTRFPFEGYAYVDLMPLFKSKDRFNVTHPVKDPDLCDLFNAGPLEGFADRLGVEYESSWTKAQVEDAIEDHGYTDKELQTYCDENDVEPPKNNPGGLVSVYNRLARLAGWPANDFDPFGPDESKRAVTAFEAGEFDKVLLHNLADVVKTDRLASLIPETRSIPKKEYEPTFY